MEPILRKKQIMERLTALCMCLMIAALGYIGYYLQQYYAHRNMSENLTRLYENTLPTKSATVLSVQPTSAVTRTPDSTASSVSIATETEIDRLLRAEIENSERFKDLLEINEDFRGMLIIDGLFKEPLPYVQYSDNDKYLNTDFSGKKSDFGTIFLSAYNDKMLTDYNNIFFGHHLTNGTMFTALLKYEDIKTWGKAPTVVLDDLTGKTTWLIFAAYTCEPDYGYVNPKINGQDYADLLEEINSRSLFHTNIEVTEEDRIIALSTCNYDFLDARFVVHARKLREGEEIPEIKVEKNAKPKPASVPNQIDLSSIPNKSTAVIKHPKTLKTYYYQIGESGIEWYVGNTSKVQGSYSCFSGKFREDGELSAIYEPETKTTWIATDGMKGKDGVYLLNCRLPSGAFKQLGRVTREGVDARHPLITQDGMNIWLLYSVKEGQEEKLYRVLVNKNGTPGGMPECILTTPEGSDPRAVGMYKIGDNYMLVWREVGTGQWYGGWIGYQEVTPLPGLQEYDKIILYDWPADGRIPMIVVKKGKITGSKFSITWVASAPTTAEVGSDVTATPDGTTVEPDVTVTPDGTATEPDVIVTPDVTTEPAVTTQPTTPSEPEIATAEPSATANAYETTQPFRETLS